MNINKTASQEYGGSFLRPTEKKILDNKHSFVSPSRTPPKTNYDKGNDRTPNKYKSLFSESTKTSGMSKGSPEGEEKKVFRTLNEIVETKNKEKLESVMVEPLKGSCGRSRVVNGF